MADLLSVENFLTLLMLILLQAVLGFDNLLYISLESKKVAPELQPKVRQIGIGIAILLRLVLLFLLLSVIEYFQEPLFSLDFSHLIEGKFNIHALVVLLGGGFIIQTATKEVLHMVTFEDHEDHQDKKTQSMLMTIFWIVVMNLVFSFDSILSAMALTKVFAVMAVAIVVSGVLMVMISDHVSEFLKRNRMYEVLGLFILLIVGVMLLSEGGHLAHLHLFGYEITPMSKSTFYFVIAVLVITDLAQGRYDKKLQRQLDK
jgi:predicted tellurium resistance membrane protein TerC